MQHYRALFDELLNDGEPTQTCAADDGALATKKEV